MNRSGKHRVVRSVKGKHGTIQRSYWVSSGAQKPGHAKMLKSVSGEAKGARVGTVFGAVAGAAVGGTVGAVTGAVFGAHTAHKGIMSEFRGHDRWSNPMHNRSFVQSNAGKFAGMYGTVAARGAGAFGTVGMAGGAAAGAMIGRGIGRAIGRRAR